MISVNYVDVVYNNQVYCAIDIIRNDNNIYYHLLLVKLFGAYDGSMLPARGEMIALAAINPKFRNELVKIAPNINCKPTDDLNLWRSKYRSLQYSTIQPELHSLLTSEIILIYQSKEISMLGKIMAKNLPSVMLTANDKGISLILGSDANDLPYDKIVLCLVKQLELSEPKIIGFRRPTSKQHLLEIIKQANDHNLLIYYSSFTISGKEILAEGPWILLPASLRNFTLTQTNESLIDEQNVEQNVLCDEITNDDKPELIEDDDGLTCPFCDKKLKSLFGLTNHVNHKHPSKKEEYERAYKN